MKDYKEGMKMNDVIEKIGNNTLIQHGKENDRVYLMKLDKKDTTMVLKHIEDLAENKKYGKLFCKIPKSESPIFIANGYILEAYIPRFYNNQEDVFFVSKFLNPNRHLNIENEQLTNLHKLLLHNPIKKEGTINRETEYKIRRLDKSDVEQITVLYSEVFKTYPFPIQDPDYIKQTMDENIQYFGALKNDKIVALASSEMDEKGKNSEMTDFATNINHLGNNLSGRLLAFMEEEMKKQGLKTLYTIARLNSIPMNKTFIKLGYEYSGTLLMNTNIAGQIESMNIYYKHI